MFEKHLLSFLPRTYKRSHLCFEIFKKKFPKIVDPILTSVDIIQCLPHRFEKASF